MLDIFFAGCLGLGVGYSGLQLVVEECVQLLFPDELRCAVVHVCVLCEAEVE